MIYDAEDLRGLDIDPYYQKLQRDQLEWFQLLNERGHLFFRSAA
jgi:hypothetical protein